MDGKTIKRKTEIRKSERSNLDGMWNLIQRFIVPFRAAFFQTKDSEGNVDWRRREIFDSTAILKNANLAAHIHMALTNSQLKWFGFKFQQAKARDVQEAQEWLEESDKRTYESIQSSNFDLEANELYLDLTAFGTGNMISMPEYDNASRLIGTDYKTVPVDEAYFDLDVKGNVLNFYRILNWTASQIVDKFPNQKIPEKVMQDYNSDARAHIRHTLIFCIFKREFVESFNPFETASVKKRPYGSKYVYWDTSEEIGEEGGHHECPVVSPRWRRVSGSQWGFSPGMIAIWDVLTLNQLTELILVSGEKVIDPAIMMTKKGVFGDIDLSAGGAVVVRDLEKSMKAFESKARFDVSSLSKQELVQSIRDAFFADDLQLKESPAMTAAEVYARIQLMQKLLGPTFGRLQTHFLNPIVSRQFMINFRNKIFSPMPVKLSQMQADLQIDYLGTLAKSQKMDAVNSVERWMGITTAMAQVFPGILDIPNADEVIRNLAENEGIPTKLMNSSVHVERIRKLKAKKAAQQEMISTQAAQGMAAEQTGKGMQAMKEGMATT
jgi:hypothetical protein